MLTEKVQLLGAGLYRTIPNEISISAIPTASELEYIGSEDFDKCLIEKIFPQVIEDSESMDFYELLDCDYDWICRCLRIKSYGPYFTTNRIFCDVCGETSIGDYEVDLRHVGINVLPDDFTNEIRISSDEFIEFKEDFVVTLPTVKDALQSENDTMFTDKEGNINRALADICYSTIAIGGRTDVTPIDVRTTIQNKMIAADYEILKDIYRQKTNYGLHVFGDTTCPNCGNRHAKFFAYKQDKFFRPSVGDLQRWKSAIRSGEWEGLVGDPSEFVRNDD